jgi:hypothetical protein
LEVAVAVVLVSVIATLAFTGDSLALRHAASAFAETKAARLAAGRLEQLRADPAGLRAGVTSIRFPVADTHGLPECTAVQTVRLVEPGLFEVRVEVRWRPAGAREPRHGALTTWLEVAR